MAAATFYDADFSRATLVFSGISFMASSSDLGRSGSSAFLASLGTRSLYLP